MTKKDLVKELDSGTVRCRIDGVLKQFTRNTEITGITKAQIKKLDKGASICVFELGSREITTITNAEMDDIIGTGKYGE
jgi:hypothetical protein